ncbi:hypothetical protein RY831_08385 [Noviherbaspirillum sp. CPCC 100848]|uniref:Uncharacterized protein n=1 Tax=Noviherbaspirillum album TaxID=3080276 RepID=A0ABU6J6U8_9BURK|nr:hypothetical protein [Noviherbaspirillum sp. CPCC 100848]MEC4719163.1 hypothetical protein [Noviherbaspirillum sp. CPCC 100848]
MANLHHAKADPAFCSFVVLLIRPAAFDASFFALIVIIANARFAYARPYLQ